MKNTKSSYHAVVGCCGAHNLTVEDREANDFYATQPIAAEWLLKLENLDKNIWECACGQGHLANVFKSAGHNVKATDLIDRGYGIGGIDFLQCKDKFAGDIVTNPPYKHAQEFIEHALDLVPVGNKVCMFLKVQFLEGASRRALYDTQPPKTVYVSTHRIHCGKGGNFSMANMLAFAWYVWEKGFKGTTSLKWFN